MSKVHQFWGSLSNRMETFGFEEDLVCLDQTNFMVYNLLTQQLGWIHEFFSNKN